MNLNQLFYTDENTSSTSLHINSHNLLRNPQTLSSSHKLPYERFIFHTNKLSMFIAFIVIMFFLTGCSTIDNINSNEHKSPNGTKVNTSNDDTSVESGKGSAGEDINNPNTESSEAIASTHTFINPEGTTIESRINPPSGYKRIPSSSGEFAYFTRNMLLKEDGSKVMLYNGNEKSDQTNHVAVFQLSLSDRDLQQCADSIIRVYAEYYWSLGEYDKIAFHLTNGFLMEYTKWRDGNRLKVDGNNVSWSKTASYDNSYENFLKYIHMVYVYAGTLSLSEESNKIPLEELRPGDMFLEGGSPGHCLLIIDIAENIDGERSFLLAQGYMPAQDFHVLKNPLHPEDPWYYVSEVDFPLSSPSWRFDEGSLVRWGDFPINVANEELIFSQAYKAEPAHPAMSYNNDAVATNNENQVTLLAVGDNLIHIEVVESGEQIDGSYNYDHLYDNIIEDISAADISIINQETILGGSDFPYSGYPAFNSPTEIGDSIVKAGFDVVLHATNHTLDKKLPGVLNTFSFWKQYPQVKILGINETKENQEEIDIIEKNNIKIAMLNYTYGLNGYKMPSDMPYLVNMLDYDQMERDIKRAKEVADFIVVFPHWGTEYVYEPVKAQKDLAKFYFDNGVDLIIGTHPHVLEPVEWMRSDDHEMLIYYSLGNFISYQKEAPRMLGGMANITIVKNGDDTSINKAGITAIVTHYEHGPSDYNYGIYKLEDYTPELASKHGVSDLAKNGPMDYYEIYELAKEVLGEWFDQ